VGIAKVNVFGELERMVDLAGLLMSRP
jgi:hypothetical protein